MSGLARIDVPPEFQDYTASAILRLRAQHPNAQFHAEAGKVRIVAHEEALEILARELRHALYRERILERTLAVRAAIAGTGR